MFDTGRAARKLCSADFAEFQHAFRRVLGAFGRFSGFLLQNFRTALLGNLLSSQDIIGGLEVACRLHEPSARPGHFRWRCSRIGLGPVTTVTGRDGTIGHQIRETMLAGQTRCRGDSQGYPYLYTNPGHASAPVSPTTSPMQARGRRRVEI